MQGSSASGYQPVPSELLRFDGVLTLTYHSRNRSMLAAGILAPPGPVNSPSVRATFDSFSPVRSITIWNATVSFRAALREICFWLPYQTRLVSLYPARRPSGKSPGFSSNARVRMGSIRTESPVAHTSIGPAPQVSGAASDSQATTIRIGMLLFGNDD